MASSTRNVKLGVCKVFFGGKDMGLTQGGVEVTVGTETHKVEVDQFGKTAINELVQGRTCVVKAPLAETTLRNMVDIMPGATLVSNGASASATITFVSNVDVGDTVTIGGKVFTFAAVAGATHYTVVVGEDLEASLNNLVGAIQLTQIRPDLGGVAASVDATGKVLKLQVRDPGPLGNNVALATDSTGVTSGANFAGGVEETRARVEVTSGVGVDLLAIAQQLRLHPVGKADEDFSDDFILYRAGTGGALSFAYKLDAERIYNVEFNGYPDPVTTKVFALGDPLL